MMLMMTTLKPLVATGAQAPWLLKKMSEVQAADPSRCELQAFGSSIVVQG